MPQARHALIQTPLELEVEIAPVKCPDEQQLANSCPVPQFHDCHIKMEGQGQCIQGLFLVLVLIGAMGTSTVPTITTTIDNVLHFFDKAPTVVVNGNQ
jgi:hypothetical protein